MSLFCGDVRLITAITLGLEDIKKNPWLITDVLGDLISNPYLAERYGNQIPACQQWLENNRINVYLSERNDNIEFPAVTIQLGESTELTELKTMGDLSTESTILQPNEINRPVPYVIKPQSGSYNSGTGLFNFTIAQNLTLVAPGMVLVDPLTGTGFKILSVDSGGISIGPSLTLSAPNYGVIPQYQFYEAKVGHTFFNETYQIGCHGLDQQTNLWLHSIIAYSLLRYRQSLLEANGFAQTTIKSSQLYPNGDYSDEGQVVWTRNITVSGQVENSWVMAPHRYIETVNFKDPDQNSVYFGGIKILSNKNDTEDLSQVNWAAIADSLE